MSVKGAVVMTPARRQLIDLLTEKPGGMLMRELVPATGKRENSLRLTLGRGRDLGLFVRIGNGTQALWGLPENVFRMNSRLGNLKRHAQKKRQRLQNEWMAVYRATKPKRRLPVTKRVIAIPAINSVWALAA